MEERSEEDLSEKNRRISEIKASEMDRLKTSLSKGGEKNRLSGNQIDFLFDKLQNKPIIVKRLDYYGNSIPLGAFCYAVPFILYGFYETDILKKPDKFTYLVLLFFGGLGQITAGLFEYIKSRTFPTIVYLLYGIYFISFFLLNHKYSLDDKFDDYKKVFYGTWAGLSFPIFIGSLRTNLIYLVQNLAVCGFFVIKCIEECTDDKIWKGRVAGILELVTGFFSIYLCFSQIINEHFKKNILTTIRLKQDNEIDFDTMRN